jgi:hypothetical protein
MNDNIKNRYNRAGNMVEPLREDLAKPLKEKSSSVKKTMKQP